MFRPLVGEVPQVVARVAPAVLTASDLLKGVETSVRTVRGLGPSAPYLSTGAVLRARTVRGLGPTAAGYPGSGLCAGIFRDAGPLVPGMLDPDVCVCVCVCVCSRSLWRGPVWDR